MWPGSDTTAKKDLRHIPYTIISFFAKPNFVLKGGVVFLVDEKDSLYIFLVFIILILPFSRFPGDPEASQADPALHQAPRPLEPALPLR